MENQLRKIHKTVFERPAGSLPSQPWITTTKEKKNEQLNAIGLRSGKAIDNVEKERELVVNPKPSEEEVNLE